MKNIILIAVILVSACSKKFEPHTVPSRDLYYENLEDFELDYEHSLQLDMNKDGETDFVFASSVTSDPLNNAVEKLEFRAYTRSGSLLYLNRFTPEPFNKNDKIVPTDTQSLQWRKNNAVLATKIFTPDPSVSYWDGAWKDQTDKYLPVKLKGGEQFYTGWIRMSVANIQSKIIIHDYAFSKIANAELNAGQVNL